MPSQSPYVLNPVSIHGEYIQLQALTGTAPVAASQSVGRIFASGSTAQLYFINEGGTVQALGGADPPTADGDTLGTADKEWSDLYMADGSVIYLGNDQEVTMTHIHDTGVRLNGAMKLQFRDADVHVSSDADGYLNAQADTGVNINVNGTDRVEVTSAGMNVVGTLTGDTSLTLDTTTITTAEIGVLDSVTAGTAAASKAVVLDASKNIATIGTIGCGAITSTGASTMGSLNVGGTLACDTSFTIDSVALNATELGYLDSVTAGTAAASKAVVLDASKNIATIGTVGCGAITSTGASSFGASTLASLTCTAGATFGGGYGSTGATISTAGVVQADGNIETAGSFVIGSADMSEADLEKLDGITDGTAAANKALVLGARKQIGTISHLTASNARFTAMSASQGAFNAGGIAIDGAAVTATAAELNLLDGGTSVGSSITVATTDGLVVNDGGTMKLIPMSDMEVFMESNLDTLSNVTTVGALNAGSITSGFGNIDNGSSTLDTGAATVASLTCTAAGTFGGGYGSTGATISTAGVIQADGNIETAGSFVIGSADMDETDLEKLDGITNGTAAAAKALVLDANGAIGTISHLTASNIKCDTLDVKTINSVSETALTLEVVDKTILAGLSGSSSDVNNGGYQVGGTIADGGMARMLWSDTGQSLMVYSGSTAMCAFGKSTFGPVTNDGVSLGMTSKGFSDLFLASGAVVNFDSGDVTLTHAANTLTVAGGTLAASAVTTSTVVASGRVQVDDATEATTTTDGSLQTDGGLSVAKSAVVGDDLDLLSDGAIFSVGSSSKFILTDQNSNNTLMATAGHRLAFGDAGEYISGDGTDLSVISSGDIKLDPAGGTVDVDGNIVPNSDSADDLGASGTAWANLYVDAIDLNGQGSISMGGTGRIDLDADDDTSIRASADDVITFEIGGSDELHLNANALGPAANDGLALGVAGTAFSDLFLASGAVVNFANGDVTMTHSSGYLTLGAGQNMKAHAFVTYSDARMKKNVKQLDTALDTVQKLRGVSYDWKHDNSSDIGFIAQEVAEVVPSLCHGSEDGGYALDYPSMNALLVEAVKQQQEQLKALSAKVEELSK